MPELLPGAPRAALKLLEQRQPNDDVPTGTPRAAAMKLLYSCDGSHCRVAPRQHGSRQRFLERYSTGSVSALSSAECLSSSSNRCMFARILSK